MLMRFAVCAMCVLLSACSTQQSFVSPPRPQLNLPNPDPLKMAPVKFRVIHKDNAERIFSELEEQKTEPVLFGLTGQDYKHLAVNIQKLKEFILHQRSIIQKYKQYYEEQNGEAK